MSEEKEKYPWDDDNEQTNDAETEETAGAKIISWVKNHKKVVGLTIAAGAGAIFLWKIFKSIPDTPDAGDELMNTLDDPYDPFKDYFKDQVSLSQNDILEIKKRLSTLENDTLYSKRLNEIEANIDALKNQQITKAPVSIDTRTFYRMKYPNIPEGYALKSTDNPLSKAYWISDNVINVASHRDMALALDAEQAMRKASEMMSEVIKSGIDLNDVALMQLMVDLKEHD